jgi:hypothetical protein
VRMTRIHSHPAKSSVRSRFVFLCHPFRHKMTFSNSPTCFSPLPLIIPDPHSEWNRIAFPSFCSVRGSCISRVWTTRGNQTNLSPQEIESAPRDMELPDNRIAGTWEVIEYVSAHLLPEVVERCRPTALLR